MTSQGSVSGTIGTLWDQLLPLLYTLPCQKTYLRTIFCACRRRGTLNLAMLSTPLWPELASGGGLVYWCDCLETYIIWIWIIWSFFPIEHNRTTRRRWKGPLQSTFHHVGLVARMHFDRLMTWLEMFSFSLFLFIYINIYIYIHMLHIELRYLLGGNTNRKGSLIKT